MIEEIEDILLLKLSISTRSADSDAHDQLAGFFFCNNVTLVGTQGYTDEAQVPSLLHSQSKVPVPYAYQQHW